MITKISNLTYTQMARWVDGKLQTHDYDEDELCEYIYRLIYIHTLKHNLLSSYDQVEDFVLYCTSRLVIRLRNTELSKSIKSISNYIKNVVHLWRADYIKEFCSDDTKNDVLDFDIVDFSDYLIDVTCQTEFNSYNFFCSNISDVIHKHLAKIPRRRNSAEWSNICISCLLTLEDRINFAVNVCKREGSVDGTRKLTWLIQNSRKRPPILFHISEDKENYVCVLVIEIIHAISAELSRSVGNKVNPNECMKNLVMAALNDSEED